METKALLLTLLLILGCCSIITFIGARYSNKTIFTNRVWLITILVMPYGLVLGSLAATFISPITFSYGFKFGLFLLIGFLYMKEFRTINEKLKSSKSIEEIRNARLAVSNYFLILGIVLVPMSAIILFSKYIVL